MQLTPPVKKLHTFLEEYKSHLPLNIFPFYWKPGWRVWLGEFTEARPEGERGVATSAALSSPPGECLWYCDLGTRGPERRKRAGKIVLQSPNLPPTSQASTHKQDSYTNLASDCSFDETQVRRREAALQKRGWNTHTHRHSYYQKHLLCQQRLHREESGTLLSPGSRDLLEEVKKRGTWMDTLCSLSGLDPLWVSLRWIINSLTSIANQNSDKNIWRLLKKNCIQSSVFAIYAPLFLEKSLFLTL